MTKIKILFSSVIGAFFSFFGILAIPLALLVPCNVIDYFTGMAAAKIKGEKITSEKGFKGILKKVLMYVLIFVGFGLDCMIGYVSSTLNIDLQLPLLFSAIIASWLVINELISITENCEVAGVKLPILAPILLYIKDKLEISVDMPKNESDSKE